MNKCDDRTMTSTGWFVLPNMAMDAVPESASLPRAKVLTEIRKFCRGARKIARPDFRVP
jgi:hypothetical protein